MLLRMVGGKRGLGVGGGQAVFEGAASVAVSEGQGTGTIEGGA